MIYFKNKYKQLIIDYKEFYQFEMKMKLHMSGSCVPSN